MTTFDGTNSETLRTNVRNFTVTDGVLYILEEGGNIYSTVDLLTWTFVDQAVTNASSIEVLGDDIYVGTEDAKIYWSDGGVSPTPQNSNAFLIPIYMIMDLFEPSE